jgi:hypothetical protein
MTRLIPQSAFIAAVGRRDGLYDDFSNAIVILPEKIQRAKHHFAAAMDDGCDAAPDWLLVSGTSWRHISSVLAAASSRLAIIAELPIGAMGRINRELSVALVSAGLSTTPAQAALFLNEAFDIIVVADTLSDTGIPCVKTVLATALSDRGTWAPKTLYSRS